MDFSNLQLLFLDDAVMEDITGGSRTAARELAHGLVERGHAVTFLVGRHSPEKPADETKDGVRILRYAGAGQATQFIRQGQEACERLLQEKPFDLVHIQFAYASVGPLRAVPKSVPRVRTFHGPWDKEGWIEDMQGGGTLRRIKAEVKRGLRRQVERRSLESSTKVLTLSRCFQDMVMNQYGVQQRQIEMIPGGTNTRAFCPSSDKAAVRRELGMTPNQQVLLSIRRLSPRMGLDKLIQSMPEVIARCPAATLIIGGTGPEAVRLQQLIDTLGLAAYVRLVGFITPEKLVSYYQAADLFVLPTLALEGFGLVTTEALSCGLPVIGTPVGATPEILAPLDRRLIATSSEPHGLAEAISNYLQGTWRQALTPAHLHEYILRNYTWDRHVAQVEQVYKNLIESQMNLIESQMNRVQHPGRANTWLGRLQP